MLNCLQQKKSELRNPRIKKTAIWNYIKQELIKQGIKHFDEAMIERKFRNMKSTFKTIKDNKKGSRTGRGTVKWEYFEAMEEIFSEDKTINIGHTLSSFPACTSITPTQPLETNNVCHTLSSIRGTTACTNITPTEPLEHQSSDLLLQPSFNKENECHLMSKQPLTTTNIPSTYIPTPNSSGIRMKKPEKAQRSKQLYGLRKKQLDIEELRTKELQILRKAIEEHNQIQKERNEIMKGLLKK